MSAIPPNNLEQLVAWIRLFSESTTSQLKILKEKVLKLEGVFRSEEEE